MNTKILALTVIVIMVIAGAATAVIKMGGDKDTSKDLDINLEIYGNADKDWDIDSDDANLVSRWIEAESAEDKEAMESMKDSINLTFADANRDGIIDSRDVDQINALATGSADHIWFLDGIGNEYDMDITDIQRIGCEYYSTTEAMLILGQNEKIVAVDNAPYQYRDFYFTAEQQKNLTNMVNMNEPDYSFINTLNLDVLLIFSASASYEAKQEKLPGTDVLYLGLYNPDLTDTANSSFIQGMLKAGYIFGAVERAEAYTNWVIDYRDKMMAIAGSIPDEEKPAVAMSNYTNQYFENGTTTTLSIYTSIDPLGQAVLLAGGKNILGAIGVEEGTGYSVKIGIDTIFNKSPVDYFFLHTVKYTYGGGVMSQTPDHGYLQDDYGPFEKACTNAKGQSLVSDESISIIAGDFRNGCTGGILLAAYMGNLINPEYYSDIDPMSMHQEYIGWMGIEGYDINEHGVFICTA